MRIRSFAAGLLATSMVGAAALAAPAAQAAPAEKAGTRSLAQVLTSDGNRFDRNPYDFDIVTEAVLAVLKAKPNSPVGVLADGSTKLTAFIPNDQAFRKLVKDLTGDRYASEKRVFNELAALVGVDVVEQVLLYHVVPGAKITSTMAKNADGADLTMAQGGTVTVNVIYKRTPIIALQDGDSDDANPYLDIQALDINKANKQIAHGITRVLRPSDL
jgi:uncharacterized surface protein with fasciclin (FAS1) repeats